MRKTFFLGIYFFLTVSGDAFAAKKIKILASFSILADIASEIGGEHVEVESLIRKGTNPHLFELGPQDLKKINEVDLFFVNGLGFEVWLKNDFFKNRSFRRVTLSEGVHVLKRGFTDEDPHAWQDPANGKIYAGNVSRALISLDPAHKRDYEENLARYTRDLDSIHFVQLSSTKSAMTLHDAFQYLGGACKIRFSAPIGWNAENEPRVGDLAKLIMQIQKQDIQILFYEQATDKRVMEQVSKDYHVKMAEDPLISDTLTTAEGRAPTYVQLLKSNIMVVSNAVR